MLFTHIYHRHMNFSFFSFCTNVKAYRKSLVKHKTINMFTLGGIHCSYSTPKNNHFGNFSREAFSILASMHQCTKKLLFTYLYIYIHTCRISNIPKT